MNPRAELLHELLLERILVLDGGTGTALQARDLTAADFGGPALEGCNEALVIHRPDVVRWLHDQYFAADADMVETNTFGGTPIVLAEYGLEARAREINRRAAEIATEAARAASSGDRPRFVAGSLGPTTKAISVTGGVTFDELQSSFRAQAEGLLEGGVDVLLIETTQDTRNIKAAIFGVQEAMKTLGREVPILLSATIEPTGTMLAGQSIEAFYTSVMHVPALSIGLNCATGPEKMAPHIRALSEICKTRVSCYPNAGLPNVDGSYSESPADLARELERFVDQGWLNIVGGCCGTSPAHVRALAEMVRGKKPRRVPEHRRAFLSGIDWLEVEDDNRPLIIGERTNVLGSRRFKELVGKREFEQAAEIGRAQVKGGAHLVDVCLQDPDRDEAADVDAFLAVATKLVRVPFVIDSTDAAVIERALAWCQGKGLINSVNYEDGEERFERVANLARRWGAALVVGTIDEDPEKGMAVTRERKLEIARRAFLHLTERLGFPAEDIVFDPLVFPVGTGDANYRLSAIETIEGLRAIKAELPECRTVLGISNVSFGLPAAGREVLNSAYLYHATKAGLDFAIVNSERLVRFPSISEHERELAENLLFARGEDPLTPFAEHFKGKSSTAAAARPRAETPDERLAQAVIEGSKIGLIDDLEALLAAGVAPLDIINGPLMKGMAEVGRLFGDNALIVAEVLQSAEVMKAAVGHLEPKMGKSGSAQQGKVLLATVKGDVHDIGKNLVDIIFSNNGFEVKNLGIKIDSARLIDAVAEHQPDVIGLSGLLVKSAQQMVTTADDLKNAGVSLPLLVGGAALSENFTDVKIAPAYGGFVGYAQDAMSGLDLLRRVRRPEGLAELERIAIDRRAKRTAAAAAPLATALEAPAVRSAKVTLAPALAPPRADRAVLQELDLVDVWRYVNPQMLYAKHLGLRGSFERLLEAGDEKARELLAVIDEVKARGKIRARAVWRYFEAASDGNDLMLFDGGAEVARFAFPRQRSGDHLSIPDFVRPRSEGGGDSVALFVTTAGEGIRAEAERLKHAGEYLACHALQALALETAEAAAEWLHAKIRAEWGFPDPPATTMLERFQARYHGKRYSFGYPACPDLGLQRDLFRLLKPEDIGVALTEEMMMDPEASVSAVVLHHSEARYFAV